MTNDLAELLLKVASSEGIDAELYGDYSGRDMFGKSTTAITVGSRSDLTNLTVETAACTEGKLDEIKALRTDNLGRDLIVY